MKHPRLKKFPVGAIVYFIEKKKDDEYRHEAIDVAIEKFLDSNMSLSSLISLFRNSKGIKKEIIGDVIVIKLLELPFCELSLIDELLGVISDEYVWSLITDSQIEEISEKAFIEMNHRFDIYILKDEVLAKSSLDKELEKDDLYLKYRKRK